jgi:hypothetical protein
MKIIYDDLFKSPCDYVIVTTNNSFDKNGRLIMGKGAALDFKKAYPEMIDIFSALIKKQMDASGYYGLILDKDTGIFQVKYDWRNPADLELITKSTYELLRFAKSHKDWDFGMNFPGIGKNTGELTVEEVLPIVSKLPDNVYLYIYEK